MYNDIIYVLIYFYFGNYILNNIIYFNYKTEKYRQVIDISYTVFNPWCNHSNVKKKRIMKYLVLQPFEYLKKAYTYRIPIHGEARV